MRGRRTGGVKRWEQLVARACTHGKRKNLTERANWIKGNMEGG